MLSCPAWAQLCAVEGEVTGEDGSPAKGVVVKFTRSDGDGNYQVKTDKKGHFYHGGLPHGTFRVSVEVDAKEVDSMNGFRTEYPPKVTSVNFDLRAVAAHRQQLQKAAEGKLSTKETRKLSAEDKAVIEAQSKEREKLASKNKDLTDAYNAGVAAFEAKQYDEAVTRLTHAAELDAGQMAVWSYLAQSYIQLGDTKTGDDKQAAYEKGCEAYQKALALKDDGALHGKYALAFGKMGKLSDAESEYQKAAEVDPANAARYYFNQGTMYLNGGKNDDAGAAFKKAIDADPNFADAHFQYAVFLSAKMPPPGPDGKVTAPPGMQESLQKYLTLAPTGPNAEAARSLLALVGSSISTTYRNPNADKGDKGKKH